MSKPQINHFLSNNNCYGKFETPIASATSATLGTKRLVIVNIVTVAEVSTYFAVYRDEDVYEAHTIEVAKEIYNSL